MRRRDEQQFAEFAMAARDRLRRTAYLISGDWELASDIVQEALIRVYVAWPRIDHKGGRARLRPTVPGQRGDRHGPQAVEHRAADRARRRWTELPGTADHGVPAREALLMALRELPPRQRACVVLRYFEDLSVHDTALVLGCHEGTVKSQTARALDSLRAQTHIHDLVDEGTLS